MWSPYPYHMGFGPSLGELIHCVSGCQCEGTDVPFCDISLLFLSVGIILYLKLGK